MKKEKTLGILICIVITLGCVATQQQTIIEETEAIEEIEILELDNPEIITYIEHNGKIYKTNQVSIYNIELEEVVKIRLSSNISGTWVVGYKVKDSFYEQALENISPTENITFTLIENPKVFEDYETIELETNSSFNLKEGSTIYLQFEDEELYIVRLESIRDAQRRILLEAYSVAFYESIEYNKACTFILDRTKTIANKVGVEVFALYEAGFLKGHVIPVVEHNDFYYGVQPHILNGYTSMYRDYGKTRILRTWEFKELTSSGSARLKDSETLTITDNIFIHGFYFADLNTNEELKDFYIGHYYRLEDIKTPYIKSLLN